jgi:hypothetical protein
MKNSMRNTLIGVSGFLMATTVNAADIFVSPDSLVGVAGSTINAVVKADFTAEGGSSGGGFELTWDPTRLALDVPPSNIGLGIRTILLNQFLADRPGGLTLVTIDQPAGSLNVSWSTCTLISGCDSAGTLFDVYDLQFSVLAGAATGLSPLTLGINAISDPWFDADGNTLDSSAISYTGATLDVQEVPLPAAVWLFGTGLLGLAGIARRRNQAEAATA